MSYNCISCNGRGHHQRTRQVLNMAMSLALSAACGVMMAPQYRTEFYNETCHRCVGTGKERK